MPEAKSGSNVLIVLLIVGGVLVLLAAVAFIGLALVGFLAFRKITPSAPPPPMVTVSIEAPTEPAMPPPGEATKVFDRGEILKLVGRSKDDVRNLLGAPDKTSVNANGSTDWMYRKRSRDTETGKIDASCSITIGQDGTVTRISF